MKDLVSKIKDVREEIYWLEKSKSKIMDKLRAKKERLKSLEELTVNQISMLDAEGF